MRHNSGDVISLPSVAEGKIGGMKNDRAPDPLPIYRVRSLLYELCVECGFCLPPQEQLRLEEKPPMEIDSFTDAVFVAEGMNPYSKPALRKQVRERVAKHFADANCIDTRTEW